MQNKSGARSYARNLVANWIGQASNMIVLFFLSPFVVHTLGTVQYGIWSLMAVVTGYMGILDLGVRASTGRHITLYLGKGDHESIDETVRTSLAFFSTVGLLIVAVGAVLGWGFPSVFSSIPPEYYKLVSYLLPVLAFNMWINALRSVLVSVLVAHDRFDLSNAIEVILLAVRTVGTVIVLKAGLALLGMTLIVLWCSLLGTAIAWMLAKRTYRRLRIWPLTFYKPRMKEILDYGIAAFISAIAVKIIGQTDLIIVGSAIDVGQVTIYSVGAMLIYYSSTFIDQIGGTFFPPVQRAVAKGEIGDVKWLFFRQVRLALILGIPLYVGFIVFAEPFINLWMFGPSFPETAVKKAASVMVILSVSKLFHLITIGSDELLASLGYIKFNAVVTIVEAFVNLVLSLVFVLLFGWGLAGVASGTVASRILIRAFVQPWYACGKIQVIWSDYLLKIVGIGMIAVGLFFIPCLMIREIIPADSWGAFALQILFALASYVPIALWLLLPEQDRKRLWSYLFSPNIA